MRGIAPLPPPSFSFDLGLQPYSTFRLICTNKTNAYSYNIFLYGMR